MAIKGRSRSRGGKGVARPPRPAPIAVRTPILLRRNFWIGAGVVVGALTAVLVAYGLMRSSREAAAEERRDAQASATRTVTDAVTSALEGLEWRPQPELLGLPSDLATALQGAESTEAIVAAGQLADELLPLLADARTKLDAVDVLAAVRDRGFGQLYVLRMIDARRRLLDGLDLYRSAAEVATQLAVLEGPERDALLATARSLATQAGTVTQDGYQLLTDAQVMAGTYGGPQIPGPEPAAFPTG